MGTKYREVDANAYVPIEADKLVVGVRLPFNIFVEDKGVIKPLFNKETIFTSLARNILKEKGISRVYVAGEDKLSLYSYLQNNPSKKDSIDNGSKTFKEYSFYKEQHYPVDRVFLIPGMEVNFSLFLLNKLSFTILLEATPKRPEIISEEVLTTEGDIVIKKSDIPLYQGYLNSLLKSENISEEDKFKIETIVVKENAKITVKDLFDNPFNSENIKASKELVAKIVDCVLKDRDVIYDMVSLKTYDYYTYIHSVNVAVMSAGLGAAIGLKREDIEKLGIGALLHDIGKSAIPHEILNKQGSLDNTEFQIFKTHVIEGEKILRTHNNIPEESFDAVLQHHEKLSGKGYPSGLSEKDIKLFGRITAIADCYDALTTPRIKKYPLTPFFALSVIAKETINYDRELLKEFVKMLGKVK